MSKKAIQLRIIFMGTSDFARDILAGLLEAHFNIIAVYTRPEKKSGHTQKQNNSPVKELAIAGKIPVFQPDRFTKDKVGELKQLKPDIIIVAAFGKILPESVLEIPGFGCLNVHTSLLPKFRGPSPIQNALLNGEKKTGITIILMDKGIDTGDILNQKTIPIENQDDSKTLYKKCSQEGISILLETIPLWIEKKIVPQRQDDSKASLCQLIEREDGKIIWEEEAENIYNKYKAFYLWPEIFCFWMNNDSLQRIKLKKIILQKYDPQTLYNPGEVFEVGDKIGVQTLKGVIVLEEIQLEGKATMSIKDFLNGYPNFIGSVLK